MNKDVNRKLEDENLEANGSSDVVAFGYSEMNENMTQENIASASGVEHVDYEIDGDVPFITWKMVMPNEMAAKIGMPRGGEFYRHLSMFEAIELLPSLRGACIVIEGDFE